MEPMPMRERKGPQYPTKGEVLRDPRLLERPSAIGWQRTAAALGAAGILWLAPACPGPQPTAGDIAPPPAIRDETARQIIQEAAADAGILLAPDGETPDGFPVDLLQHHGTIAVVYVAEGDTHPSQWYGEIDEYMRREASRNVIRYHNSDGPDFYVAIIDAEWDEDQIRQTAKHLLQRIVELMDEEEDLPPTMGEMEPAPPESDGDDAMTTAGVPQPMPSPDADDTEGD